MATPEKTTGSGTKAYFSTDKENWLEFASVSKITPPSYSRGTVDVTDMNSYENNNQFKEFLGDFIEADEMGIEGYFVKGDVGREALEDAFFTGKQCHVKVQLPPAIGKDMVASGVLTKYQPMGEISPTAGIAFSMSMKPNSKPEMTDTSKAAETNTEDTNTEATT